MFAFIWSIGTTTTLQGRQKFDKWLRDKLPALKIEFPVDGLVYDYIFDRNTKTWISWLETIREF